MSFLNRGSDAGVTAEEFLALNRQVSALVKLGLPLERHLAGWNRSNGRRLKKATRQIAVALGRGESFDKALLGVDRELTPVYRAVLDAGQKTGNISLALDELTQLAERTLAIRGLLLGALLYPLLIVFMSWGVLLLYLFIIYPILREVFVSWSGQISEAFAVLDCLRASAGVWGPIVPVVVILLWLMTWLGMRKSRLFIPAVALRRFCWFPGVRRLLRSQEWSVLADMLALMTRRGVALDQAVQLSAAVFGDRKLELAAADLAEGIGNQDWQRVLKTDGARRIPGSLRWAIVQGIQSGRLSAELERLAGIWRRDAWRRWVWLQTVAVPAVVVGIGGLCVLLIALSLWGPWLQTILSLDSFRP